MCCSIWICITKLLYNNTPRVLVVPAVKTLRSESAEVYFCSTIFFLWTFSTCELSTFLSLERTLSAARKHKHKQCILVQSQVSGKAVCINCDWHFIKDRLLKLYEVGWENAICKCQITGKIFKFFMLLSQPLISAFQLGERNTVNVQGWILKLKKLDCLYSSSDSSPSESQETIAAFVPQGRVLLHRLLRLEEAGEATLGADEGHSSFCLRKSVKCIAVYLFINLLLIVLSASVYWIEVCWSCLENLFPIKWPRSTCLYWLMSLAKDRGFLHYWISGLAGCVFIFIHLPNFHSRQFTPLWSNSFRQTNEEHTDLMSLMTVYCAIRYLKLLW